MHLPPIGTRFEERYEIREVLGQGGFAMVYLAWDGAMSRDVVLKVLRPQDGEYDTHVSARFLREARVFAELQDPHTITMYDFGQTDSGLLFMVFEYVAGQELSTLIAGRSLPVSVVRHIARQLLSALHEAHLKGVLHRDIKPANILVYEYAGDPYRVKLLDFGIAKDTSPTADSLTKTGGIVGTLRYMAPEQLAREQVGPESDLYSLGLVMFEMLTGRQGIDGASQREMLLQKLLDEDVVVPPDAAPPELRAVVDRLLKKERAARFATAAEVVAALRATRAASSVPEPEPSQPTNETVVEPVFQLDPRDRPVAAPVTHPTAPPPAKSRAPGFVVGLLAALAAGVAVWTLRKPEPPRRVVPPSLQRSGEVLTREHAPKPKAATEPEEAVDAGQADAEMLGRCGGQVPFYGEGDIDLGLPAPVRAYFPKSYDGQKPLPAIAMFHRSFRDGSDFFAFFEAHEYAEANDVVLLAFKSSLPATWRTSDIDSIVHALNFAHETHCLDRSRLALLGDHQGAPPVYRIPCMIPVSATAVTFDRLRPRCEPVTPTPTIRIYGLTDMNVPVKGGRSCSPIEKQADSAAEIEERWRKRNECRGDGVRWGDYPDGECTMFSCGNGDFAACSRKGGHHWPGSAGAMLPIGCKDGGPDRFPTSQVILDFFREKGRVLTEDEQNLPIRIVEPE